jgi:hypothetical protein
MALFFECMQQCARKVLDTRRHCQRGDVTSTNRLIAVTTILVRFWTWNGVGAARSSKNTPQLRGKVAFESCWFGGVEGLSPAIWSLGSRTRNRWITRRVERKLTSVLGVVVTSENGTHPARLVERTRSNECNRDVTPNDRCPAWELAINFLVVRFSAVGLTILCSAKCGPWKESVAHMGAECCCTETEWSNART